MSLFIQVSACHQFHVDYVFFLIKATQPGQPRTGYVTGVSLDFPLKHLSCPLSSLETLKGREENSSW